MKVTSFREPSSPPNSSVSSSLYCSLPSFSSWPLAFITISFTLCAFTKSFWTVGLKTLESPLDSKEIKPVHPKGNQSWVFIGRTDAEAPILWPPDTKSQLTGKDTDAVQDWGQEEKGATEDETVGWHHQHNGHAFVQTPEAVKHKEAWRAAVHGTAESQIWLSSWAATTKRFSAPTVITSLHNATLHPSEGLPQHTRHCALHKLLLNKCLLK